MSARRPQTSSQVGELPPSDTSITTASLASDDSRSAARTGSGTVCFRHSPAVVRNGATVSSAAQRLTRPWASALTISASPSGSQRRASAVLRASPVAACSVAAAISRGEEAATSRLPASVSACSRVEALSRWRTSPTIRQMTSRKIAIDAEATRICSRSLRRAAAISSSTGATSVAPAHRAWRNGLSRRLPGASSSASSRADVSAGIDGCRAAAPHSR